jgi:hypothetical protein
MLNIKKINNRILTVNHLLHLLDLLLLIPDHQLMPAIPWLRSLILRFALPSSENRFHENIPNTFFCSEIYLLRFQ